MKARSALCFMGLGMGSVLLYQQIKNGNLKNITKKMNKAKTQMLDDLENMM